MQQVSQIGFGDARMLCTLALCFHIIYNLDELKDALYAMFL
jgi:hypothetical protein